MQKWLEQAAKNELEVLEDGLCQLCGAETLHGLTECVETAGHLTHKVSHAVGIEKMTIFLCVDAHALTHMEIHGRWNNHFHLARLHLILVQHVQWCYDYSSMLSEVVDTYKIGREQEYIRPISSQNRPKITVTDIDASQDDEDYIDLVWRWAYEVYTALPEGHAIAADIAHQFIQKFHPELQKL
ncbi:DUF5946 family protein [Undibacterium fentianense]|uniref:Uncharacterized protein n=1 Tax=Undibacterium fentianense TaxID=2828728 RepID=A0A941E1N5_9BURK|nr:DUF5946 family protein [Undibacterium fentianense]MBR7799746.1 hypothetical protein [Undibacterium fentianense]